MTSPEKVAVDLRYWLLSISDASEHIPSDSPLTSYETTLDPEVLTYHPYQCRSQSACRDKDMI